MRTGLSCVFHRCFVFPSSGRLGSFSEGLRVSRSPSTFRSSGIHVICGCRSCRGSSHHPFFPTSELKSTRCPDKRFLETGVNE